MWPDSLNVNRNSTGPAGGLPILNTNWYATLRFAPASYGVPRVCELSAAAATRFSGWAWLLNQAA